MPGDREAAPLRAWLMTALILAAVFVVLFVLTALDVELAVVSGLSR